MPAAPEPHGAEPGLPRAPHGVAQLALVAGTTTAAGFATPSPANRRFCADARSAASYASRSRRAVTFRTPAAARQGSMIAPPPSSTSPPARSTARRESKTAVAIAIAMDDGGGMAS